MRIFPFINLTPENSKSSNFTLITSTQFKHHALDSLPSTLSFGSTSHRSSHQYVSIVTPQIHRTAYMTNICFYLLAIDVEDDQVKLHNPLPQAFARCYWDGTSPFCAGSCDTRNGWVECGRDGTGNGATCVTGYKKYCCRESCSAGLTSESHNGKLLFHYGISSPLSHPFRRDLFIFHQRLYSSPN